MFPTQTLATVLLLLLLGPAHAAPVTPNPSPRSVLVAASSINECYQSTFVDQTSGASPSVSDCRRIADNIRGGGSWRVESASSTQHQLVQFGSCAFGVQVVAYATDWVYRVGNQDIIDLIEDSIRRFEKGGRVGSKGVMLCNGITGKDPTIMWGLY